MRSVTIKFTNDYGVSVTLRGKCILDYIDHFDICGNAVFQSKSDNVDDITAYEGDGGVKYFPFYFFSREEYGEDYEVHAYFSESRDCWVVSHITAYDKHGDQIYEIGGRTQVITIRIK